MLKYVYYNKAFSLDKWGGRSAPTLVRFAATLYKNESFRPRVHSFHNNNTSIQHNERSPRSPQHSDTERNIIKQPLTKYLRFK